MRVVLAFITLTFTAATSMAEPAIPRDEPLALRSLYCAYVNSFWYKYLTKNEPNNPGIDGYREGRNAFWMAATVASDGEFIAKQKDNAERKVVEVLQEEKAKKIDLMSAEAMSCLETLRTQVIPLLKEASGKQ